MASRDPQVTRPQSQHRQSATSASGPGVPVRHSANRHHSHSVSLGSVNPTYRVTRRKSINATSVNSAATVRAALGDLKDVTSADSLRASSNQKPQRSTQDFESSSSSSNGGRQNLDGDLVERPFSAKDAAQESAIGEGFGSGNHAYRTSQIRARRASEGSYLARGDGKRSSGELRCEKCGKGYKHSSCLTKHLWEHDPAWAYTSKLLISKHQQVQLLEAASVLVNMNQDEAETDRVKSGESDDSSASPAASGSSDIRDDIDEEYSSAETTPPPPMSDQFAVPDGISTDRAKRHSGMSSSYSRSYQSAPSSSLPASNGWSPYASQSRPSTSGYTSGMPEDEETGLAAAVEALCNFGTPRTGPVLLPSDVPPVPPLPARYVEQNQHTTSSNLMAQPEFNLPSPTYQPLSNERDARMRDEALYQYNADREHDSSLALHVKGDEDEGVFGGMEGIAHEAHRELSRPS